MNAVTEIQQEFPQRKQQFDAELGALDAQIQSLNNLLGRCAGAYGCRFMPSDLAVDVEYLHRASLYPVFYIRIVLLWLEK